MVVLGGTYNKLRGGGDYSIRSISLQNVVKHNKTLRFKCSTLTSGLSKIGSPSSWLCVILAGIILNFNFYQLFFHISKVAPPKFWSCTTTGYGGQGEGILRLCCIRTPQNYYFLRRQANSFIIFLFAEREIRRWL